MELKKESPAGFDQFADNYDETLSKAVALSGADRDYFSEYKVLELLKYEEATRPIHILDFGCGTGSNSVHLKKHFQNANLFGVDISRQSIAQAAKRSITDAEFDVFDGTRLSFDDETFDVVFASMVFHHIERRLHVHVLREIRRTLRQGGRFYNFEHNPYNPLTRKVVRECAFDGDAVLLKPAYNRQVTAAAGLEVDQVNFTLFVPRHKLFSPFRKLEPFLTWCPAGAQYYVRSFRR